LRRWIPPPPLNHEQRQAAIGSCLYKPQNHGAAKKPGIRAVTAGVQGRNLLDRQPKQ
jgi:hypothetical protein